MPVSPNGFAKRLKVTWNPALGFAGPGIARSVLFIDSV